MACTKNRTISELSQWAADPQKATRFEAIALLSQRTAFVKELLGLREADVLVRKQIQAVCARHGIECRLRHGKGFNRIRAGSLYADKRYAASFLIHSLLGTSNGGTGEKGAGIASDNLVDRMIYSYRRLLALSLNPHAQAALSFENFYALYQSYLLGEVDLRDCHNCGASYISVRYVAPLCPLCVVHGHAKLDGRAQGVMHAEGMR
jgi:hypothetical protein